MTKNPVPTPPSRDPGAMLERTIAEWGGQRDLWIFGYASLIWRPDFEFVERRPARVYGWHRALRMWSHVNRGTPEQPGLVCAMLSGGSCQGIAFRIARSEGRDVLARLWERELGALAVYDPKWIACKTLRGTVTALGFTLSRDSPNHAGVLGPDEYRRILLGARGKYGTTFDYVYRTLEELKRLNIRDRGLEQLLRLAESHTPA